MPLRHDLLRLAHGGHGGQAPRLLLPQRQQLILPAPLGLRLGCNGRPGGPPGLAGLLPGVGGQGGEGGAAAQRRGEVPGREQPQNVHNKLGRKREEHGPERSAHKPQAKRRRRPAAAAALSGALCWRGPACMHPGRLPAPNPIRLGRNCDWGRAGRAAFQTGGPVGARHPPTALQPPASTGHSSSAAPRSQTASRRPQHSNSRLPGTWACLGAAHQIELLGVAPVCCSRRCTVQCVVESASDGAHGHMPLPHLHNRC